MRTAFARVLGRRRTPFLMLLAVLVASTAAWAYWAGKSSGSASGHVGTLSAPTISSATPGGGTVTLNWTTVTPPAGDTVSYYVSRDGGGASGACPSSATPGTQTSCTDTGVSTGSHSYTVTAVWRSWTAKSESASAQVTSGAATHLVLSPATSTPTAGAADNLTITAKDAANNTVTSYGGSKSLTFSGASTVASLHPLVTSSSGTAIAFGSSEPISFSAGVASVSGQGNGAMTLYKAETASIKVSDGTIDNASGVSVTVGPATASSFTVPTPSTQTANNPFTVTLTAIDAYGNTATGYSGNQAISFAGPSNSPTATKPTYPSPVSFTAGVGQATLTLYDAETTSLTASQTSISGTSGSFAVGAASAQSLTVPTPGTQTAGAPFEETLTAKDAYGNIATGYTGERAIAFSGPANSPNATAPKYSPASFSGGEGKVSLTLYDAQTTTLSAKDNLISISGSSGSFAVTPGSAAGFTMPTPATQTAGAPFNVTLTAKDAYGNTATGYSGNQAITFSGPEASPAGEAPKYPATVSFTSGEGKTPSITLYDGGSTTLTAKDGASVSGSSGTFTVNGLSTTSKFLLSTPSPNAGSPFTETITATDAYGNTTTGFTGSHTLSFGGPASGPNGKSPSYPPSVSFTSGVGSPTITLYDVQTTTLTAKQSTPTTITGTTASFAVAAGNATSFTVPTPSTQTAGVAFSETLTALDAGGNTATGYSGEKAVAFTGPESSPSGEAPKYPASVSFSGGAGTASVTLLKAGTTNELTATQGSVIGNSNNFAVNAGAAARLAWEPSGLNISGKKESALCLFTCTWKEIGRGNEWSAKVTVTDGGGNIVSNLGSGHSVTFSATVGSVSQSSLSLPSSGSARTGTVSYTSPSSNSWSTDTLTAHATGYTDATVLFKK
ncbi:MAG: beta strand repeat-containing protein [Solirubrobacterales bacterium]